MGLMEVLFGQSGGTEQLSRLSPEQQQLQQQLLGGLGGAQQSGLGLLQALLSGDESAFQAFEAPMKRQFEQETIPMIAERFAGMGTGGSQSSSAQNLALGQAGRELTENLAQLRGGLQQQALGQLGNMLGMGLSPTMENIYKQPTAGLAGGLATGAGSGLGMAFGGGPLAKLFGVT